MSGDANLDMVERARRLRQKVSHLCVKAAALRELTQRAHERSEQLATGANEKKMQDRELAASGVQFLKIDLDLALTFARIALQPHCDPFRRARNQENAQRAHDAVVHWSSRLQMSRADLLELDAKLQKLRSVLERLGKNVLQRKA